MARPTFKPTNEQRQTVAVAAGSGASHEVIAIGLGIDRKTLEKHFSIELTGGAYKKRLEVLKGLYRAAKKGNVAAAKAYLAIEPRIAVPPGANIQPRSPAEPDAKQPPPFGKKDQAQADAVTAATGTEWESLLNRSRPLQ